MRSVWTGSLSFGLVNIPVRLVPAIDPKDVRFHLLDRRSGRRVRYQRVVDEGSARSAAEEPPDQREAHDRTSGPERGDDVPAEAAPNEPRRDRTRSSQAEVSWNDVVKSYEVEPGRRVSLSREEIERVTPTRSRSIDIEHFVDLASIDPVYYDKSYYLAPHQGVGGEKAYVLLQQAMGRAHRVGIGRFVLRAKPRLVLIRPTDGVLALQTLFFGDEVRAPEALVSGLEAMRVTAQEIKLAGRLIETLAAEWDPSSYADTYREELLRLIAEKAPSEPEIEPVASAGTESARRLMDALKASVEAAQEKEVSSRKRTRSGRG
jgi:DNA end-binding protein Ku